MTDAARLEAIVRGFRGRRVLVLADLVADEFVYGRVERISREAPVLILKHDVTDVRLGGGANAVHNIRTLGAAPLPFGVVGRDPHGRKLSAAAAGGAHRHEGRRRRGRLRDARQVAHPRRPRALHEAADRRGSTATRRSRRAAPPAAPWSARSSPSGGGWTGSS